MPKKPNANERRKAASILASHAGSSGTGDSKRRGNSAYYSQLAQKAVAARPKDYYKKLNQKSVAARRRRAAEKAEQGA